jgi:multidrug resistance efflux pump
LEASLEQAMDELELAQTELQRAQQVLKQGAGSPRDVDNYRRTVAQSEGAVGEYQAELTDARYDLEHSVVRAPSDGFVTQLTLRPGATAPPIGLKPVMTFIHKQESVNLCFTNILR